MKIPDRQLGAGGSLIRANLFDAEATPPYSRTRHGDKTILKRDGRLTIRRDTAPAETEPPWLLVPYSYDAALSRPFEILLHRIGLGSEQSYTQTSGTTPANQQPAVDIINVGGGWALELYQVNPARTMHLRLRSLENLDETADLGITINPFMDGFPFTLGVSLCALGWRDEENGYAFAAYYFHNGTGENVCVVGSVKKKAITNTVNMPASPSGEGWWTPPQFIGQLSSAADRGYAKMYAVGRGQLLGLLMPRESIEYGIEGGVPQTAPRAGFMKPTGAPQLVRSRDFGDTWELEPAPYLARDGVFQASSDLSDPDAPTYGVPVRYIAWGSNFFASPIGGGRVAIVAGGPSDADPLEFDPTPWPTGINGQTLRFYISGSDGSGFMARPWPLDAGRNGFPPLLGTPSPGTVTVRSPLFGYRDTNVNVLGSLGPGTFFVLAEEVTRTTPGLLYGDYPAAQPLLAFITRDYGVTWETEQIPSDVVPFARTFYENKAGWNLTSTPIISGAGTQVPDSWMYNWLGVCVTSPSGRDGKGGEVAFFTGEMTGPLALAVTSGKKTFGTMKLSVIEPQTFWTPHPDRVRLIPKVVYTGDTASVFHPEYVHIGYPEFEDRT